MSDGPHLKALEARGHWGIKKGLDNIRALLGALGNPEAAFPAVLIAGTNGKGSTGAFLASALKAAGHRVGWTTSPHLLHPRERIWVDGKSLEAGALEASLAQVFQAEKTCGLTATYFELMIAAAMLAFRDAHVALALVEVGMGGRWDSTNALDPILTVLTNVALDHTQFLGDTREAIGREKLCTARDGRPLVLGPGLDPVWVRPLLAGAPELRPSPTLPLTSLTWGASVAGAYTLGLPGRHQAENAATAREALVCLAALGIPVPEAAIHTGFAKATWPGRLWRVPGLEDVWMDGAHNPHGAQALVEHAQACGVRPHLLFGAMGDKDLKGVAALLQRMPPASVTLVKGPNERYASPQALKAAFDTDGDVLDLEQGVAWMQQGGGLRLVTGSLFMLGDLLRTLTWEAVDPPSETGT